MNSLGSIWEKKSYLLIFKFFLGCVWVILDHATLNANNLLKGKNLYA